MTTVNEMHANALSIASKAYAEHTGIVEVGGIKVDAQKQAASYRRAAAMFLAADKGVTDPDELRAIGRAS